MDGMLVDGRWMDGMGYVAYPTGGTFGCFMLNQAWSKPAIGKTSLKKEPPHEIVSKETLWEKLFVKVPPLTSFCPRIHLQFYFCMLINHICTYCIRLLWLLSCRQLLSCTFSTLLKTLLLTSFSLFIVADRTNSIAIMSIGGYVAHRQNIYSPTKYFPYKLYVG